MQDARSSPLLWIVLVMVVIVGVGVLAPGHPPSSPSSLPVSSLTPGTRPYYVALARQDALAVNINPDRFIRQINQESGFRPNVVSPAGAIGIAQFEPSTAQAWGVNPYDPEQSLQGAAQLMAHLLDVYHGDSAKALAAYNAGEGTVNVAVARGGASWQAYIPLETQHYIAAIL